MAGDQTPPAGEYASTLEVFESGALDGAGFVSVGVAGHPEGNPNIPPDVAWDALARKQAWGVRTGVAVHVATQFGFDAGALAAFDAGLTARGIALPVHVGVAGPASLKSLAKFAVMCGIGASLGRDPVESARARQPQVAGQDGGRGLPGHRAPGATPRPGSDSCSRTSSRSAAS